MADSFTSELAERLLRRATRPVGVIDVRPAQQRYERAAAWPRQHVTMLDRAAARQQTDPHAAQDQRLLLAARPIEAAPPLRDMSPGDPLMEALRSSPAALSPASLARIAARQRSGSSEPAVAASAAATAGSRDDGPSRTVARGETIVGPAMRAVTRPSADLPLPSRGGPRHADRGGQSEPSSARSAGDQAPAIQTSSAVTPTESTAVATTEPAATSTAARAPAVRSGETAPATIDTPHVFVQRRQAAPPERSAPAAAPAPIQKATASASIAQAIASQPAHAEPDLSLARSRRVTTAVETPTRQQAFDLNVVAVRPAAAHTSPATAVAVADPVAAPLTTTDREPSLSLRSVARSVPSLRQSETAQTPQAVGAAAPVAAAERRATESAPLQLVWRRGSPHDTATAAAAGSTTASHSAGGGAASASPATGWTSPSAAGAVDPAAAMTSSAGAARESGGGMDLEQIVEEVMRRLDELMRIERERGGDPWL